MNGVVIDRAVDANLDAHNNGVLDEAFCALSAEVAPADIAEAVLACPPLEAELRRRVQRRTRRLNRWQARWRRSR